jgi:hypothetical protein
MQLYGLERGTTKPAGGITTVELIAASEFESADWDVAAGCFTSVQTSAPMACYVFREDGCTYTEKSTGTRQGLTRHTLSMEFTATDQACQALSELVSTAQGGLVAIVTTGSGSRLLVGYSPKFGGSFPLRIESHIHTWGTTPADFPTQTIVLESEDVEPSRRLNAV